MVTITKLEKRKNSKDEEFNVLVLQGNVEVAISKTTGRPYLTARKTSIPVTFDVIPIRDVGELYKGLKYAVSQVKLAPNLIDVYIIKDKAYYHFNFRLLGFDK